MDEKKQSFFESKIAPILEYIGIIGASLMSIAYFIVVYVMVHGFEVHEILETTIFAVVNAAVGFIIMQFLKVQGVSFAKNLDKNKEVLEEYYNTKTREKKFHSITYFWVTSVIKDIFFKGLTLAATTIGIIYIVIQGSNDYSLYWLAAINLTLFICFGLLSLVKAYDAYNNEHIPYLKDKLNKLKGVEKNDN